MLWNRVLFEVYYIFVFFFRWVKPCHIFRFTFEVSSEQYGPFFILLFHEYLEK